MIPVVDVGIGVGYLWFAASRSEGEDRFLFNGLGRPGDEEKGSKAGSSVGAGRFTPDVDGRLGWAFILLGDESIISDKKLKVKPLERGYHAAYGRGYKNAIDSSIRPN